MNIDWSRLEVCPGAGTAAEVPRAIEALFSNSAKQRRQAYWQLDNFVVVQGGLFESAAYAGRLLVQQIKAAPENVNEEVLDLLFELANGNAAGRLVTHGPLQGQPIQKLRRDAVGEVLPLLAAAQTCAAERARVTIQDLLSAYNDVGSHNPEGRRS